jgi:ferredoxin-NADP reductase
MATSTLTNTLALLRREEVAHGTLAFHFDKPAGFEFRAGQSIDLTLLNPAETDAEGNTRAFSIASAPSDPQLTIATRMRDTAFKRTLAAMPLGGEVKIDGPGGSFTLLNNAARKIVFLAGGIGITPFLSMIRHASLNKLPHQLYLFYSNRRPEDAPFVTELQALTQKNPNFHFVPTMTEMEKSKDRWDGERGFISREMLAKHLPDLAESVFYVAGPPAMVAAMRQMLVAAQVDEDDIRTEEFAGY